MSKYIPNSNGLMRSTLRDSLKRLRTIRVRAGKNDEVSENFVRTGDPFRDKSNEFVAVMKSVKEKIHRRNDGLRLNGNDRTAIEESNDIRRDIQRLHTVSADIKVMVDAAEGQVAKENKKKKPNPDKVRLLNRQFQDRLTQHQECVDMLELVRKMEAQRLERGTTRSGNSQVRGAAGAATASKKAILVEQLNINLMRHRATGLQQAALINGGADSEMIGRGVRLEEDPETREQMRYLADQEAKINKGLDRLGSNIGRLHELALEIGAQLDMQNVMLEKTEDTVDKRTRDLKDLNRRLRKILKAQSPVNTFLSVACICIILAMVGFLLYQFQII